MKIIIDCYLLDGPYIHDDLVKRLDELLKKQKVLMLK